MKTVSLELDIASAEHILREAAFEAAFYGGYLDHVTGKTVRRGGEDFTAARKRWRDRFLRAKRIVEAFSVDVESISEEEAIVPYYPPKPDTGRDYVPDYSRKLRRESPHMRDASEAAARRVLAHWRTVQRIEG